MTNALSSFCKHSIDAHGYIDFDEATLATMSLSDADNVIAAYGGRTLMRLPAHEVIFQEWLRINDIEVWSDLWSNEPDAPYLVSLSFVKEFIGSPGKGAFLICDLQAADNYYFTPDMLLEKESTDYVSAVRDRFLAGGTMTVEQAITVEMSAGPMDIWHFAYLRSVELDRAKRAVASLVEDRIIVHVPKAEHLSSFFDVG
ncbi:MAG: hypothetical protein ACK5BQ_07215 [Ignavibacteria bacterium]|jgi:hypothetical protein